MNEFNFNSAVCTSIEQSRKLLSLGLKVETADMYHIRRIRNINGADIPEIQQRWSLSFNRFITGVGYEEYDFLPAWSLHRLYELYNSTTPIIDSVQLIPCLYDMIIDKLEVLIKKGYFNKEYLEEE